MDISKKLILTDCDGVLLDWEYGFHRWATKNHNLTFQKEGVYGLEQRYGIEKGHAKALVRAFNESSSIGSLSNFRDAKKYVRKLNEEFGFIFGVITSLSDDENSYILRKRNLENVFGSDVFEFLQCLAVGADKDEALKPYEGTGCIWVEDKDENAVVGADLGLNSYLMIHDHNKHVDHEGVTHVSNWKQIYEDMKGLDE